MDDQSLVYATASVIVIYLFAHILCRRFDPFSPVWLFLVGFAHVYVIQAMSYREWAIGVRGIELVTAANLRALWSLIWFLAVCQLGPARKLAPALPQPPRGWSPLLVADMPGGSMSGCCR